jgi:hypothetical protein
MEPLEIELRARIIALELLVTTAIAHAAALTERPDVFLAQLVENATNSLRYARDNASPDELPICELADIQLANLTEPLLALAQREAPEGQQT